MTIEIPSWLITACFYLAVGIPAVLLISGGAAFSVVWMRQALKSRKSFWLVSTWIFCHQNREDKKAFTLDVLRRIAAEMSRENPDQYRQVRECFNYWPFECQVDEVVEALLDSGNVLVIGDGNSTRERDHQILTRIINKKLNS